MLPPIARQKKRSIHETSPSKLTSPTPPSAPVSAVDNNNTPTRQLKATQTASVAAIIECTAASRNLIPGLADLFSSNYKSSEDNNNDTASSTTPLYHPALPSVDAVKSATSKMINDKPPFITMSIKDTAPQLKLEDPPKVNDDGESSSSEDKLDFQRQLVVKGTGMKGYRMSRATQGVKNGCYYYEAMIGVGCNNNNKGGSRRGVKRSFQEENKTENVEKKEQMNGHLRIGWSTREGDLQAPVGYNEHSFAIRDIGGSRIHKSQREDKWGGDSFGVGDVLGIAICLVESSNKNDNTTTTTASIGKTSSIDTERKDTSMPDAEMTDATDGEKKNPALPNHIRFFINGKPMGEKGIAFDNVNPGTYHPAISCYKQGSAQLNFGPHFVYPPQTSGIDLHPISGVCTLPPQPEEEGVDKILSGDSTGKVYFSKKTDEAIESVFKEFVKLELKARFDAHMKHLNLHRKEIAALRKERGLSTDDLA